MRIRKRNFMLIFITFYLFAFSTRLFADNLLIAEKTKILNGKDYVEVEIDTSRKEGRVSSYIASANINSIKRHLLENEEWNIMMKNFFQGGFLRIQVGMYRNPDGEGNWWNFELIDKFIKIAKEKWEVNNILICPTIQIPDWDEGNKLSESQISKVESAIRQLAERYGSPGKVSINYWEAANELWGGYWEKNPEDFLKLYTNLLKKIKGINPELKVGGPVDAWPIHSRIEGLIKEFPELDFVSWHMYLTSSPPPNRDIFTDFSENDSYKKDIFTRALQFYSYVLSSQEISKKILGKTLPVIVSEYHINYHAWEPPDPVLCTPLGGVWNALVLSLLAKSGCFAGMIHDIRAVHYGLFGPNDTFSSSFKIIPLPSKENESKIYIRPIGFIHYFFIKHIAGREIVSVTKKGATENFEVISTTNGEEHSIVLVNFSPVSKKIRIKISGFNPKITFGFKMPIKFIYCDSTNISMGEGTFFNTEGRGNFEMPPYSTLCLSF